VILHQDNKNRNDDDAMPGLSLRVSDMETRSAKDQQEAAGYLNGWFIVRRHLAPSVNATPPIMKRWETTEADTVTYAIDTLQGGQS
jgi:hypothetical protein